MLNGRELGLTFPLRDVGFLDFESKSETSITAGTYRYATEAEAIVLAYALADGPVRTVAVGSFNDGALHWDSLPPEIVIHHARVLAGEAVWAAWNAGFDKAIWNYSTLGFPLLSPCHVIDVMAQATASGLPADLGSAARVSGSKRKLDTGGDLLKLFCLPGAEGTPTSHPDEWQELLRYARSDVEALRSVFLGTRQLAHEEWREYWAMETINETGIRIDVPMVAAATALAMEDRHRSRAEMARLTNGFVKTVDEVKKLTVWLMSRLPPEGNAILTKRSEEVDEDGVIVRPAKHALTRGRVERLIAFVQNNPATPPEVLQALQLRLYGGSRTPAKFGKMLAQHVDGVLYGQYVFNGAAQTGRASSRGVQIHNLARDALKHERAAIDTICAGCVYDDLLVCNPDPVARQLSLLIRPTLVAGPDHAFVWSDWSQIEARILPWLAGDDAPGAQARLEMFKAVDADPSMPDLYVRSAAEMSNITTDEVTPAIRQRGKIAELALGFAGGVGALQNMAAGYGMHFSHEEAKDIVDRWRKVNTWAEKFWNSLEKAALDAKRVPGEDFLAGRLCYTFLPNYLGGSLLCQLPSGRHLVYRDFRHEMVEEEDDDGNVTRSEQLRFSRGYGRVQLWRGMFCENAVQAVAADCLRGTLVRLTEQGYCVRAHTHDEIVLESLVDTAAATKEALRQIMRQGFDWSQGLPLMSEETVSYYYSKSKEAYGL